MAASAARRQSAQGSIRLDSLVLRRHAALRATPITCTPIDYPRCGSQRSSGAPDSSGFMRVRSYLTTHGL